MVTINYICDKYLEEKRNKFAERRCKFPDSLESTLKPVRAAWGAMDMADFRQGSKARSRELVQQWRDAGINTGTCRKRISTLKAAINFAIDEELISRDLEPVLKLPAQSAPRTRFVDMETELPRLLAAAEKTRTWPHTLLALQLYVRTGLRPSAFLDLTWDLVDFDKRIVWFQETEKAEDRTKKRRVNKAMDDELYAILQRAYEDREEDCPYVLSYRGKRVKKVYCSLKRLFARAGMPDLQVRDLRRTSATYVFNENEGDAKLAACHLGDTEAVTMKHYAQSDPKVTLPGVQTVSRVMQRARAARPRAYRGGRNDG